MRLQQQTVFSCLRTLFVSKSTFEIFLYSKVWQNVSLKPLLICKIPSVPSVPRLRGLWITSVVTGSVFFDKNLHAETGKSFIRWVKAVLSRLLVAGKDWCLQVRWQRALPSTELQLTMIVIMHQNVHYTRRQLEAIYNMHFMEKDCIALHGLPFKSVLFEKNPVSGSVRSAKHWSQKSPVDSAEETSPAAERDALSV